DVGFTQVIATANTRLKVFDKPSVTGTPSTTLTGSDISTLPAMLDLELNSFFANSSLGITGISDPHVRFDRFTGRWFIVAIDIDHNTNNYCCIAVSDGEHLSSNTNFKIYYFNVSQTGGAANDFFDYPTLGIDKNYLYIGGNMFANGNSFSGSNMWVVDKASLITASPGTLTAATVTGFPHNTITSDIYTPQGVHNDDPNATAGYFIGASKTAYSKLVIKKIAYGTTPTISGDLTLATATTYTPQTVPTLNGTSIDGNDRRLCAAMIKVNKIQTKTSLWIAQGTRLTSSGVGSSRGDRDGAYWAEIDLTGSSPVILQSAMLYDGLNTSKSSVNYIYPTIATSGQGHSLMGFTSAGAKKYCQAATANRFRTDATATFRTPADFTTSTSSYRPGASRWGDYTQTVVDPADDMTMWTFTEYTATTNSWGVRAAQFKAPAPATPSVGNITSTCGVSTTVTITGTSTNNSEFFDAGAGYNPLKVSVTNTSDNSVTTGTVNSSDTLHISAQIAFTASGTYTLTVTNPDGQSATSSPFTVTCNPPAPPATNVNAVTEKIATIEKSIITKTTIYPNPVHDVLNLSIANVNGSNAIIQIMDNKGHLLRQINNASINYKLNVANLSSGMYMIKIINGNNVEVQRFIKN
ncbi:MAG: T9SS type A sorting domain-containing protein, partial [Bacteroidota bacterium]|nr:T9SS type A sorting domain-containing protein [Bacteroidota bacterium]